MSNSFIEKLDQLGLEICDTRYSECISLDECESLFGDIFVEKDRWLYEYYMYLAESGAVEVDTQLMRSFKFYSAKMDYDILWGGFHIEDPTEE